MLGVVRPIDKHCRLLLFVRCKTSIVALQRHCCSRLPYRWLVDVTLRCPSPESDRRCFRGCAISSSLGGAILSVSYLWKGRLCSSKGRGRLCHDTNGQFKSGDNLFVRSQMSVHPSTKSFFHISEIWHVGRGRWAMHDGMQYDPMQGQGHEPLTVGNPSFSTSISSAIYNRSSQLTTDS